MHTTRILKVLALAMEANPDLPLPLTLDNIDLDDIISTPHAERNTAATMYARDTGEVVHYVGNSGVVYDRIDIARYWRPDTIIEDRNAVTVGDLAIALKSRYGLDVLSSEIKNSTALLPDSGTVHVEIDDAVSPLYIGSVDVQFAKDAGLTGQPGLAYDLGGITPNSTPVLGWCVNNTDVVEVSINYGAWQQAVLTRIEVDLYAIVSPQLITASSANVRIRGTKPLVIDYEGNWIALTQLHEYKSFTEATGFFSGITTLTTVHEDAFKHCPDLTSADYLFDGCRNLTALPDHLLSYCPELVTARAAFRKTAITAIPESLLESCSRLEDASMMFEQCTALRTIPAKLFSTNTGLKTIARCFMGTTGMTDEIPEGLLSTLVNLQDASYLFGGCPWVTTLPDGLLHNCTALKDLTGLFSRCSNLMVIPSDLLSGLSALRTVDRMFEGCTTVASIPPGLFQPTPNLEYMRYTFASSGILTTPAVMFTYVRRLLAIDYVFANCVKLTAIPASLLQPLLRLQSANGVWKNCIGIAAIPNGLFDGNPNLVSLGWAFSATRITAVPESLLVQTTKLADITGLFSRTLIATVPVNSLSALSQLKVVDRLFWQCEALVAVGSGLFAQNTQLESVVGTFSGCGGLTANITTWFTTMNAATIRNCAGCFQGSGSLTGTFAAIRALFTGVDWGAVDATQGVVAGCSLLTDYASVGEIYKTPLASLV